MLDDIIWHLGRPSRVTLFARNDHTPDVPAFSDNTLGVFEFERALAYVDFAAMERLLQDFFARSVWPIIEQPDARHDIHIVKATESSAIAADALARIRRAAGPHVHLHERDGGHWIHAERPDVIAALLLEHLPH